MDSIRGLLVLTGTFLPIIGILLTALLAILARPGKQRMLVLFSVPLLTFLLCWVFGEALSYNGNLLFAVIVSSFTLMLCLYYPVLIIIALVMARKQKGKSPT